MVRLALLDHHYRPDWEWTDEDMPRRRPTPRGLALGPASRRRPGHAGVGTDRGLELVRSCLDDDLDTPAALRRPRRRGRRRASGGPGGVAPGRYPVVRAAALHICGRAASGGHRMEP